MLKYALVIAGCLIWSSALFAQSVSAVDEQYAAIQAAFLREDFSRVVRSAEAFLRDLRVGGVSSLPAGERAGQVVRVWLWDVLSLERLQRVNEALREVDRLKAVLASSRHADADRMWPEICFWEGEISRRANQLGRAQLAYRRLLTNFPTSMWRPQAQLGLGLALFSQQAYEEVLAQARELRQTTSSASVIRQALVLQGLAQVKLKQFAAALATFDDLSAQSLDQGTRAQALFYRGESLTGLARFQEAAQAYQQAIEAEPNSTWGRLARFGLGWSYFQQYQCAESLRALEAYLAASSAVPDGEMLFLPEVWFARGECFAEQREDEQAIEEFQRIRLRAPAHPLAIEAGLKLGKMLERRERFDEAMAVLDPLLRRVTDFSKLSEIRVAVGSLYLSSGQPERAKELFQEAVKASEPRLRQAAMSGIGESDVARGDVESALRWFEAARDLQPESEEGLYAAYHRGRALLQAGRFDEANEQFQCLLGQANPKLAADARLALAFGYLMRRQEELAMQELAHLQGGGASTPEYAARAAYYLALVALQQGRAREAEALCTQVMQDAPASDEAAEARLLLADLIAQESSAYEALALFSDDVVAATPRRHRGKLAKKIGDLSREAGEYARAIHWYELAWQEWPAQRGELDYRLASCYEESGDAEVAIRRYQAGDYGAWAIRGRLAAAKLLEREGRWGEAKQIYERMSHEAIPEAKIAQERLASMDEAVANEVRR